MGRSMNSIARELNQKGIYTRRKEKWSQSAVARILKSPVYACADADVYIYLKNMGAYMNNPVEEYTGKNGCYIYGNAQKRKQLNNYEGDYITLGEHEGIISPDLWLDVQRKRIGRQRHSNIGTGSLSWLQGMVKCRCCGYSCYVKKYSGGHRYFYCRGKRNGVCKASKKMIRCDMLEESAESIINNRIDLFDGIKISEKVNFEINSLKIKISDIETKIERLIRIAGGSDDVSAVYINDELKRLDGEKTKAEKHLEAALMVGGEYFDGQKIKRLFSDGSVEAKKE